MSKTAIYKHQCFDFQFLSFIFVSIHLDKSFKHRHNKEDTGHLKAKQTWTLSPLVRHLLFTVSQCLM